MSIEPNGTANIEIDINSMLNLVSQNFKTRYINWVI